MPQDNPELPALVDQPARRRAWLLAKALESSPFDQALELARAADEFIGDNATVTARPIRQSPAPPLPEACDDTTTPATAPDASTTDTAQAGKPHPTRPRLQISPGCRARLLDRLAECADNALLAVEFGLGPRQIQGVRMGAAREIAARRGTKHTSLPALAETQAVSVSDVVLYLRRQDDVVVGQQDGAYLVNGRFLLTAPELVDRANRIRQRQGKLLFEVSLPSEGTAISGTAAIAVGETSSAAG